MARCALGVIHSNLRPNCTPNAYVVPGCHVMRQRPSRAVATSSVATEIAHPDQFEGRRREGDHPAHLGWASILGERSAQRPLPGRRGRRGVALVGLESGEQTESVSDLLQTHQLVVAAESCLCVQQR